LETKRNQRLNKIKEIATHPSKLKEEIAIRMRGRLNWLFYRLGDSQVLFPDVIIFVINEHCNAKCKICDFGSHQENSFSYQYIKGTGNLTLGAYKEVITSVKSYKPSIWFMAVEPLLYPHLVESIEFAKGLGLRFQITTNGLLLKHRAEELVQSGLDILNVSIDGPNPEVNDYIRGVKGYFDAAVSGIEEVMRLKRKFNKRTPTISLNYVISEFNYQYLNDFIERFVDTEIDSIHFNHYQYVSEREANRQKLLYPQFHVTPTAVFDSDPSRVDVDKLIPQIKKIQEKYGRKYRIDFAPDIDSSEVHKFYYQPDQFIKGFERCYYPWRYAHILPNGDVVAAYRCFSGVAGNIHEKSFPEIWNDAPMRMLRKTLKKAGGALPACSRCSVIFCSYKL
jgi:MoaA/NifB/PqqE/SkfB family radical SAM enzyme